MNEFKWRRQKALKLFVAHGGENWVNLKITFLVLHPINSYWMSFWDKHGLNNQPGAVPIKCRLSQQTQGFEN